MKKLLIVLVSYSTFFGHFALGSPARPGRNTHDEASPFTMSQLFDIEAARRARLNVTQTQVALESQLAEQKLLELKFAQDRELFAREALAEVDYRTSIYIVSDGRLKVKEATLNNAIAELTAQQAESFRAATLGDASQPKKLSQLYVSYWANQIELANTLSERSKLSLHHQTYLYDIDRTLADQNNLSQTDLSTRLRDKETAESAVKNSNQQIEVATRMSKDAITQANQFK